MSYQGEVSGIHQVDIDSDLTSVLDLRLLSKSLRVHQGQLPPTGGLGIFMVGQGLRELSQ